MKNRGRFGARLGGAASDGKTTRGKKRDPERAREEPGKKVGETGLAGLYLKTSGQHQNRFSSPKTTKAGQRRKWGEKMMVFRVELGLTTV